jgi:chromosome segregation ATPase
MLARREGTPAGARELMAAGQGCRSLTEVLSVEPGYERALAAALGPLIQAVVVPESYQVVRALQVRGSLEAIQETKGEGPTKPRSKPPVGTVDLWEVVSGPEAVVETLRKLVPSTAVLVNEDSLGRVGSDLGEGLWRLVSRSGELLDSGLHAARRQEVGAETLLRAHNELEAASKERGAVLARREAAALAIERLAAAVAQAEESFRGREEGLHLNERRLAAKIGDYDLHQRRLEEARLQCAELRGRQDREAGLAGQMLSDLMAVEEAMTLKEAELESARASLRALQARVETMRRTVGRLEEKKGQAALVEVRLRERCRSHENERSRAMTQRDTADQEKARCDRRVESLQRYVPVLTRLLSVAEGLAEKSRTAAAGLESLVEATRARTEGTPGAMRNWGGAEADLQREHQSLTARSTELQVDQARLEDRRLLLEGELAELRRRHLSPRGLVPTDVAGEDEDSLAAAVERAERRRERIGPVNPLAEQECAEMEERARFLGDQRRDLEASLAQLEDVIAELDEHIERSFTEIFAATREHFSAVVASVFPGAKGSLRLTEAKPRSTADVVTADRAAADRAALDGDDEVTGEQSGGIVLEVKFPNKSPRSLSLLSGGEKAMTAIAFLFSLFLARPCPFYILDEVEASLDDINIRRFLTLVRKYRERTQFIIITHQRQTMEVADTLYGVTLESDGTSRVLSRRLAAAKGA